MKLEKIFTALMTVFIGFSLLYLFARNTDNVIATTAEAEAREIHVQGRTVSFDTITTGSTGSGDALIELTPAVIEKDRLVVEFRINTHSVKLSQYDLREITTLEYDGKVLRPVKAGRIGGHHSSGSIVFDTDGTLNSFTIRIKGIPRNGDRVYVWNTE